MHNYNRLSHARRVRWTVGLIGWVWWVGSMGTSGSARQSTCAAPGPCTITIGQSYSLAFDYTNPTGPSAATGFRVYLNGVKTGSDIPLSAVTGNTGSVTGLVAPARGTYTLELTAFNADAESAKSSPALTLVTKLGTPPPPGNIRILIAVSIVDGRLKLEFRGIETVDEPVK